jgi:hypothetical protein
VKVNIKTKNILKLGEIKEGMIEVMAVVKEKSENPSPLSKTPGLKVL